MTKHRIYASNHILDNKHYTAKLDTAKDAVDIKHSTHYTLDLAQYTLYCTLGRAKHKLDTRMLVLFLGQLGPVMDFKISRVSCYYFF